MTTAVIFPGQGSQYIGMLKTCKDAIEINETFSLASDILGYDLWQLVQQGPEDKLNQTQYTQVAILTTSVALWQLWRRENNNKISYLAGHSLGEYTALVCSGSLKFSLAVKLVAKRAKLMQEAVTLGSGAMAAVIGLDAETLQKICNAESSNTELATIANINSLQQIVLAGTKDAVIRATLKAKDQGAKRVVMLPVSVPSHCALMQPAAAELADFIADIEFLQPKIPVIHNCDAKSHLDVATIKQNLIKQLDHPVKWLQSMQHLVSAGVTDVVECGPGKVLIGLAKRINPGFNLLALDEEQQLENLLISS